jgi:anhydro-N-acetylmuramic acid kinase
MKNPNISLLNSIASRKSRLIIGLMSGTSLDGLDVALCKISGSGKATKVELVKFETVAYDESIKDRIRSVFAKQEIRFLDVVTLNPWIGNLHGDIVLKCLKKWKISSKSIDCIASHGQTVFHAPQFLFPGSDLNATFQAGDGDHVAVRTGIITISDFRQKHIAAGGEGAPLAVYGDYLLFSKKGEDRILLNMGGIANFTFLPASADTSKVFVTDTGTGNTLLDQAAKEFLKKDFDFNSQTALQGTVSQSLLSELKAHSFFKLPFPKTIGPELFNLQYLKNAQLKTNTTSLSVPDVMATLTRFSAETIVDGIKSVVKGKKLFKAFSSGGGAHNPLLMKWIKELLPGLQFEKMSVLGINGDAKEAVLFAILANEALAGGKIDFGKRSKVPSVSLGKISFPK